MTITLIASAISFLLCRSKLTSSAVNGKSVLAAIACFDTVKAPTLLVLTGIPRLGSCLRSRHLLAEDGEPSAIDEARRKHLPSDEP